MLPIVRAVWACKMLLANKPAILNLLDGPVGVDLAYYIVWARFRMMSRYLACQPGEVPRIFRTLDLLAMVLMGVQCICCYPLLRFWFAWVGSEQGWIRAALPPLRMLSGPVQHF